MTHKDKKYSFRTRIAKRLVKEIKESSLEEYIIVHGGGSFGHPGAEKYKLNSSEPLNATEGLARVQRDMRRMNNRFLDLLIEEGIWGVSMPGGLITVFEGGQLVSIDNRLIERYLSQGNIPVIFGDVTIDTKRGITICSGDDIMKALSKYAEKAVFVSDVDGIYKEGELQKIFTEDMYPLKSSDHPGASGKIDVTGGMNEKVKKMLNISTEADTYLVNGGVKNRLKKILNEEEVVCTEVKR